MGLCGQRHALVTLPPGKRPNTLCIGGWMDLRIGLDRCEKSRLHGDLTEVSRYTD